jgi:hypothetical protein
MTGASHPTPRCESCGRALECFEGHYYCPDCERYATAPPPVYRDAAGVVYSPVALVPYSELVAGDRYAVPGETVVHVRAPSAAPGRELSRVLAVLYHRPVLLLERDRPDDRVVDLVDEEPSF